MDSIEKILKDKGGVKLDIGCGASKQPGFVGIDYHQYGDVDVVHNIEETPWPLPDECAIQAVSSHVLEHINPHGGVFIGVMNELWRVMKPGAQFAFVVPYAGNALYWQDPTHCNGINEVTMYYFDPDPENKYAGQSLYRFYEPKPWKIEFIAFDRNGVLECLLTKRIDDKSFHEKLVDDITQEIKNVPKHVLR
jgi:SAM-dependent methyltransferase